MSADHTVITKVGRVTGRIAQGQIGEVVIGIRGGSEAFNAPREKTDQMQARAAAIDELVASGTLVDQLAPGETQVDRELAELSLSADVEAELERLRRELGAGAPRRELTGDSEP